MNVHQDYREIVILRHFVSGNNYVCTNYIGETINIYVYPVSCFVSWTLRMIDTKRKRDREKD